LAEIHFPYLEGARIDPNTFRPIVRESEYGALSSKGAVSLVVTAWHFAMLKYALRRHSIFPMVLLLDSPLSHVGRDASDPDFKDQQMVDAFYALLADLDAAHGDEFQIIMCDNHPPAAGQNMVVVEFTATPGTGRVGLISDE
jgi:hypothetical protein